MINVQQYNCYQKQLGFQILFFHKGYNLAMLDLAQQLRQELLQVHEKHHVCYRDTDLCIEGFPRSANTFCVDFLMYLCRSGDIELSIAHHTHSPANVHLATLLQKPCMVLIRDPVSAITSFTIYSGVKVPFAAERYLNFYREVEKISERCLFVDFNLIVHNINAVITQLNVHYDLQIPLSANVEHDSRHIGSIAKERARKRHSQNPDRYIKSVGTPNQERELMKDKIRPEVIEFISTKGAINSVFDAIRRSGNYLA